MTGTPLSIWSFISACETASHMYSKCMVEPLMRTPIAMTASKGAEGIAAEVLEVLWERFEGFGEKGFGVPEREAGPPKLRPPRRSVAVAPA